MNLQVVEVDGVDEVILIESTFGMAFEFTDCGIKPDWLAEVEFIADFF